MAGLFAYSTCCERELLNIGSISTVKIGAKRVKDTGLWYVRSDVTGIRPPGQYGVERIAYGPTQAMNPKADAIPCESGIPNILNKK